MSVKQTHRVAFEVEAQCKAFFTGGAVQWTQSGEELLCQCGVVIHVVGVAEGRITATLGKAADGDDALKDDITTFVLSRDDQRVVSSHRSGLMRLWNLQERKLEKLWRSIHKGPVARLALNGDGSLLASGGSDSSVRIWDLHHQACTHNLHGSQGVVSVLQIFSSGDVELVFAAADDAVIHAWDLGTGQHTLTLIGHFSKVTGLALHPDGKHLVSCARDKVVILWSVIKGTKERTLPLYESLEDIVILPGLFKPVNSVHVATAGEKGVVRVWDVLAGHEVLVQSNSLVTPASEGGGLAITQLLYNPGRSLLAVVSADHNIFLHSLPSFECHKQLVGFSDEVMDVVFVGSEHSHLAVATNSPDIKLYHMATMGCQLLRGHSDIVLSLAISPANPQLLASSAKDNSVRLWLVTQGGVSCVATGCRHTASVGSVALGWQSACFLVSASQDCCIKMWDVSAHFKQGEEQVLVVKSTQKAHDKDINCVCVSPNDQLLATASQDKTAKLWSAEDLSLLGVLRGHRRGIWCVRFSPVDKVVLTTSADCTVKLWAIDDLLCVKTLEGHECSVLRGEFLSRGTQVVTTAADGLVKVWSIKTSECDTTLEQHSDRVWALAVVRDGAMLATGGADSCVILWRDITMQKQQATQEEKQRLLLQEQKLANLVQAEQLLPALQLALSLDRPQLVLRLIQDVLKKGEDGLTQTLALLEGEQKQSLFKSAAVWNTNSRNCYAAQLVVSLLLEEVVSGKLSEASWLEDMLPYTQRHFDRLTRLLQDVQILGYTAACMRPHTTGNPT